MGACPVAVVRLRAGLPHRAPDEGCGHAGMGKGLACGGGVMTRRALGRLPRWLTTAAIGLAACALLMGPVALFGAFTLRTSLEDLNERSYRERQDTAALAAALVGRTVSARGQQLRALSGRVDFRDALVRRDGARLSDIFSSIVIGVPDVATAGVLDPAGSVIARFPFDPSAVGLALADRDFYAG